MQRQKICRDLRNERPTSGPASKPAHAENKLRRFTGAVLLQLGEHFPRMIAAIREVGQRVAARRTRACDPSSHFNICAVEDRRRSRLHDGVQDLQPRVPRHKLLILHVKSVIASYAKNYSTAATACSHFRMLQSG
jgi:hypothetical protein